MTETFLFSVSPVDNKTIPLIGRDEVLYKIKQKIIENSCNISIIGDTLIGKSSLLKTLESDFLDVNYTDKIIPVYIDLENFAYDISGEMFLDRILKNIYRSSIVLKNEFKDYSWGKSHEFSEVIENCKFENKIILLLLDNFDTIPILKKLNNDFWTHLRSNANEKGLSIVTASRSGIETLCHKGDIVNSHFWGIFNPIITISVFDDINHAKALLSRGINSSKNIEFIISLVGLHPCFLKVAANAVIENGLSNSDNELAIITAIYEKIKPFYIDCLKLLQKDDDNIDNGIHYRLENITILNAICSSKVNDELTGKRGFNKLKEMGYICINAEGKPQIVSPLFERFLREKCTKVVAPYKGDKPYVFISYAHIDKIEVLDILQNLMENNFRFWFDNALNPGNEWRKEIVDALENSKLLVVFISPNSMSSDYVMKEINRAIKKNIKILPVYLTATELPNEIEFEIDHLHHLKKYKDENNFVKNLVEAIDISCKD